MPIFPLPHQQSVKIIVHPKLFVNHLAGSIFSCSESDPPFFKIDVFIPSPAQHFSLGVRLNDLLVQSERGCRGDLRFTKKILKSLPGIDVEETINLFQKSEVCCDCHLFHNVIGSDVVNTARRSGY